MKQYNKLKYFIVAFFISLLSVIVFTECREKRNHEYGKTFKGETIGLTLRIKKSGKSSFLRYCFYVDNKKILGGAAKADHNLVNKFYKVRYDLNNPEKGHFIILRELKPDSITLVKAGFTKTKYYEYDDVKVEYLGKWKWK